MTEKRFVVTNISANGMKGLFKLGNNTLSIYDVTRLINELLEENEQLKKENERLCNFNLHMLLDEKNKEIEQLKEENEQLKSELKYYKAMVHTQTEK